MKKKNDPLQLSLFEDEDFETLNTTPIEQTKSESKVETEILYDNTGKSYNHTALFLRLAQSEFRSSFHLKSKDMDYIRLKGLETIRQHAADFIAKRLAPAYIPNDGKQTPMRGHPVFLAQHATWCCCRGCFYKWHHIAPGHQLSIKEQRYAVSVLMAWIEKEYKTFNK